MRRISRLHCKMEKQARNAAEIVICCIRVKTGALLQACHTAVNTEFDTALIQFGEILRPMSDVGFLCANMVEVWRILPDMPQPRHVLDLAFAIAPVINP